MGAGDISSGDDETLVGRTIDRMEDKINMALFVNLSQPFGCSYLCPTDGHRYSCPMDVVKRMQQPDER